MSLPTIEQALDELGIRYPRSRKLECPKHEDKTPSLHLYEDSWYCFSCGAHGDGIGLVALFSGQDVRRLLAERSGGRRPERRATRGLSRTDVSRAVVKRRRELHKWWFGQIADAYKDSHEWALARAVDLWGQVFDDLTDRLTATGVWDGGDKPAPYEAERIIDELKARLLRALPLEQAEGERTREQ